MLTILINLLRTYALSLYIKSYSFIYILALQSSLPYRETIVEGLFSLSQLLPLVLESKVEDDSVTDRKTLMFENNILDH